jgi:hypothetical protein
MFRQSDEKPGRELFNSTQGVAMPLGSYKNKNYAKQDYKQNFTRNIGVDPSSQVEPIQAGLSTTKFGKGFYRRNEKNIKNSLAEEANNEVRQFQETKAVMAERLNDHRRQNLQAMENYNGFNIITNVIRKDALSPTSNPRHKQLVQALPAGIKKVANQGLGDESMNRGMQMLRDSTARFYTPHPSGHRQNFRQDILYREGLQSTTKYCGVLEAGKKDMISYGVEDQFSKSEYLKPKLDPPPKEMSFGLYEKRIPGVYTPRNIPNHPSANPETVHNWTTNADLFNNTTRTYLARKNQSSSIFG